MSKNAVITVGILFAMLFLVIAFILFLWGIVHISKKYGEKLNAARRNPTLPDSFVLKSAKGTFVVAIINMGLYTGTFFIFRFLLSKVAWEKFDPAITFFFAFALIGTVILIEVLDTIFALTGFAFRKLQIDGQQLTYRNWLGRCVAFTASDITTYRSFRLGGILECDFLRFTDRNGKKRFSLMYLSEYSRILLSKYLEKQGVYKRRK